MHEDEASERAEAPPPWAASGRDEITLLPRDPESAYLFWEIATDGQTEPDSRSLEAAPRRWIARLSLAIESESPPRRDVVLEERRAGRRVEWIEPDQPHRARVGWCPDDGTFVEVARSTRVQPPATRAGSDPVRWVEPRTESNDYRLDRVTPSESAERLDVPDDDPPSSS
jgi:hypothetical protein